MKSKSLPCIVCRKKTYRVMEGGHETQPSDAMSFSSPGAYGTTVFDPMDNSELVVVICDECLVKAGKDGIVHLSQPRIAIMSDFPDQEHYTPVEVGYYSPERADVVWNPDTEYARQEPLKVEPEEVGTVLTRSTVWWADGVKQVRESLARANEEKA